MLTTTRLSLHAVSSPMSLNLITRNLLEQRNYLACRASILHYAHILHPSQRFLLSFPIDENEHYLADVSILNDYNDTRIICRGGPSARFTLALEDLYENIQAVAEGALPPGFGIDFEFSGIVTCGIEDLKVGQYGKRVLAPYVDGNTPFTLDVERSVAENRDVVRNILLLSADALGKVSGEVCDLRVDMECFANTGHSNATAEHMFRARCVRPERAEEDHKSMRSIMSGDWGKCANEALFSLWRSLQIRG